MKIILKTTAFIFLFMLQCDLFASVMPLEIIYPKAAGTGVSANIPATHRVFKAYPGIEYNVRAAVIGGAYPYLYELTTAPEGATINSATGEISWKNATGPTASFAIRVTDSESNIVTSSWGVAVSASTSDFIFIDGSYSGAETGAIDAPYHSIKSAFDSIPVNSHALAVYFRKGSYSFDDEGEDLVGLSDLSTRPKTLLSYPGEDVSIDVGYRRILVKGHAGYFDGISFSNFYRYGIRTDSNISYTVTRRCKWSYLRFDTSSSNDNFGLYFTDNAGVGYYTVFQDNEYYDWWGSAIGSLYSTHKSLIENCYLHDPDMGGYGLAAPLLYLTPKENTGATTIRGNKVVGPVGSSSSLLGFVPNSYMDGSDPIEICFNLFHAIPISDRRSAHIFYAFYGWDNVNYHRNTLIGDITFRGDLSDRSISVANNVIINPNTNFFDYWGTSTLDNYVGYSDVANSAYVSNTNNLGSTSNILTDYKLDDAHAESNLGVIGWQFADGRTPIEVVGADFSEPADPEEPTSSTTSGPILRTGTHLLRVGDGVLRVQ